MLVTEFLNDGTIVHNYSDSNKYILQNETGHKYAEAYDSVPCSFTYTETEEELPEKEDKESDEEREAAKRAEDLKKLNKVKESQIAISKYSLASWLQNHPYTFTKADGTKDDYSVTAEKQQLLALEIMTDQMKINSGVECTPTWNAQGKVCEAWDYDELNRLAIEISNYVKPRVSIQQHVESQIQAADNEYDIMLIPVEESIYDKI